MIVRSAPPGVRLGLRGRALVVPGAVAVAIAVGLLAWLVDRRSYDIWGGIIVAPALVVLTLPVLGRLARREGDPALRRLLVAALVLKLASAVARYFIGFDVYRGFIDAGVYHKFGAQVADSFRHGIFDVDVGKLTGTGFLRLVTGAIYTVIGPTKLGGFFVFSWLGFWGLLFFYRAFRLAVPDGDHRLYAKLVFFLPSLLYWPSSIGKEAWMTFTMGLVALGAARLLTDRPRALRPLAAGLVGTTYVRPHMAAIILAALTVARVAGRRPGGAPGAPFAKFVTVAALLAASTVVVRQFQTYFGVDEFSASSINQVLTTATGRSTTGGSSFEPPAVNSPAKLPPAAATVLFRPAPWEAHNAQAMATAAEGAVLAVLCLRHRRRLLASVAEALRRPYVLFVVSYSLLFVYAFSRIANFGLLARQRVQLYPLFLVLLALPASSRRGADARQAAAPLSDEGAVRTWEVLEPWARS